MIFLSIGLLLVVAIGVLFILSLYMIYFDSIITPE